jgi:hypothetical protein
VVLGVGDRKGSKGKYLAFLFTMVLLKVKVVGDVTPLNPSLILWSILTSQLCRVMVGINF